MNRVKPKLKITETDIKKLTKDYLSIKKWRHFHLMAGVASYDGVCDRIAIKNKRVVFIEVKKENGKLSDDQKLFQEMIESEGGEYLIVRGIEDLQRVGI